MQRNPGAFLSILAAAVLVSLSAVVSVAGFRGSGTASRPDSRQGPSGWRLVSPVTYQNLTLFPVLSSQEAETSRFTTLDEALARGDVVISEQGDYLHRTRDGGNPPGFSTGPQVNQLVLINRGKTPVLLLAGEVVSGGKQDRIIGKDRIVPIGAAPLPLDVFCVEHGRWTGASDQFSAARMMVHPSVREEAAVERNQSRVWAGVRGEAKSAVGSGTAGAALSAPQPTISADALAHAVAGAGTQSYQKIYKSSPVGGSVENVFQEISRRFDHATSDLKGEHVVGVVVAVGDEVVWSDIFASSELFNAYRPKLLRSYVVEAMMQPGIRKAASLDDARDFLRPITGHTEEESEPGVFAWRKESAGHLSEIQLVALAPKPLTLHSLRVLHGDQRELIAR
jgi:hypothetical protein